MRFLVDYKEIILSLLVMTAIAVPLFNIILVTVQSKIKKPYHKLLNDGDKLEVYFCQKHGYVGHDFVKKNGKWKRSGLLFTVLVFLAFFLVTMALIVIGTYMNGMEIGDIIAICIMGFSVYIVSFAGLSISQTFLLKRYIKKNNL